MFIFRIQSFLRYKICIEEKIGKKMCREIWFNQYRIYMLNKLLILNTSTSIRYKEVIVLTTQSFRIVWIRRFYHVSSYLLRRAGWWPYRTS